MKLPISREALLAKVQQEYKVGFDSIKSKRDTFRDRYKLYNDQAKDPSKISINTLYFAMDTSLAMYYDDKLTVEFAPRDMNDEETAANLTDLAEFDYEEMGLSRLNYYVQWDRLFYGVGIRVKSGWDMERNVPTFQRISPLSWIPDPYMKESAQAARWHGFETSMSKYELESLGLWNDQLAESLSKEQQLTRNKYNEVNEITDTTDQQDYAIYTHYTIIDGTKYKVVLGNERGVLLDCQDIEPVTEAEKANKSLIPFPIVLNYFSPVEMNPFGVSLADLLEDKQRAKSTLANLRLYREKELALGDDVLFDPTAIKNKAELARPSMGRKYIAADLRSGTPMMTVPKNPASGSTYSMEQSLDREITIATGMDEMRAGIVGDRSLTATENQQLQANSNLKLALKGRINTWGEQDFWKQWLRSYKEYFGRSDKKLVRVATAFGSNTINFKRHDFITSSDPDIIIMSESEAMQKREQERAKFSAVYPLIAQDPTSTEISKLFAKRKLLRLNGTDQDEIMVLAPETPDEMNAKMIVELLNDNDMESARIDNINEDHYTYLVYFQRAIDTPAKFKAIENRKNAIVKQLQQQPPQQQEGNAMQGAASSAAATLAGQSGQANVPNIQPASPI